MKSESKSITLRAQSNYVLISGIDRVVLDVGREDVDVRERCRRFCFADLTLIDIS
jgi:hypothetical protein